MEKYGIGKSTVSDINKNKEKIRSFSGEMVDMGMAKVMEVSDDRSLDRRQYSRGLCRKDPEFQ